jgi:antitoxin ParD1/3/4
MNRAESEHIHEDPRVNVTLTPELEKFIKDKVASGQYATAGEVVWHALLLLEQQEKPREEQLEEFNRELQARMDAMDRGEYVTAEESLQHFKERSARRRAELQSRRRS